MITLSAYFFANLSVSEFSTDFNSQEISERVPWLGSNQEFGIWISRFFDFSVSLQLSPIIEWLRSSVLSHFGGYDEPPKG